MNGVYETTTTSGTGTVTLSAVTGRPRFSDACAVNDLVPYAIKDGNNWEWGMGTIGASNTLVRSQVNATFVSGTYDDTSPSAITLSGSAADVYLSPIAGAISPGMPIVASAYGRKAVESPHWSTYASGSLAVTANRLYLIPFKVDSSYDVNGFYIDMDTAGAASTMAHIGLYRMAADGQPTDLIIETGDIDTSVTAAVLSPSCTQTRIKPGWYYIALCCTGTPTFHAYPSSAFGLSPLGLDGSGSSMLPIVMIYKSITAGWTGLPVSPTSMSALLVGGASVPCIALKLV